MGNSHLLLVASGPGDQVGHSSPGSSVIANQASLTSLPGSLGNARIHPVECLGGYHVCATVPSPMCVLTPSLHLGEEALLWISQASAWKEISGLPGTRLEAFGSPLSSSMGFTRTLLVIELTPWR